MANDLRARVRDATGTEHQRLEAGLDVFTRVATPAGRRALVAGFHRLHAGAEAAMAPHLARLPGLDFEARRRTPHLLKDLAALGGEAGAPAAAKGCGGLGAALGWMYVLEGSTLGGRMIRRRLEAAGQTLTGLSFLDPYGDQGGQRWRMFIEVLEREGADPAVAQAVLAGALAGFRCAEAVLCVPEAAA